MSIRHTRALLSAALEGSLDGVEFRREPFFGLMIPTAVPGVPADVLEARQSWADKAAYDTAARDLVARFEANFAAFDGQVDDDVRAVALRAG
jgi:phosphoenolpyruvate carboxykinase (ATP)